MELLLAVKLLRRGNWSRNGVSSIKQFIKNGNTLKIRKKQVQQVCCTYSWSGSLAQDGENYNKMREGVLGAVQLLHDVKEGGV